MQSLKILYGTVLYFHTVESETTDKGGGTTLLYYLCGENYSHFRLVNRNSEMITEYLCPGSQSVRPSQRLNPICLNSESFWPMCLTRGWPGTNIFLTAGKLLFYSCVDKLCWKAPPYSMNWNLSAHAFPSRFDS